MDEPAEPWHWPAPPFDWRHLAPADRECAQPCHVETPSGATVEGFMLGIDPPSGSLSFRNGAEGPSLVLPFSRVRRLTLTSPLRSVDQAGRLRAERVPTAAQEREFRLTWTGDGGSAAGRTAGHVETPHGLFLFTPGDDGYSLHRVFVPKAAYSRCEFGPSAQDLVADQWIATPRALLDALSLQRRMPVLPIGQSLLNLGMVTQAQIEQALAQPMGDMPLGERLVQSRVISKADLQTAIAHKMGYPFVDLTRFPIEPAAARKLPLRVAVTHRALPLLVDGEQIIVAVDRPSRAGALQGLYALAPLKVVAVLASKGQILLALSALSEQDLWHDRVSIQAEFFSTTR